MAPQIGPNEAPMMPKTPPRLPATLVTARMMLAIVPMPTDRNGFTLGRTVLQLLAAMNEEKQAPGKAARVRPIMIQGYAPGSFLSNASVIRTPVSFRKSGSIIPAAHAPASAIAEIPAVT